MRAKVSSGTRTYPITVSPSTNPVDLWTLCCITNSLQNCCFPCVRSSDNEYSELDLWDTGLILLCSHSAKGMYKERLAKVISDVGFRWEFML